MLKESVVMVKSYTVSKRTGRDWFSRNDRIEVQSEGIEKNDRLL